MGRSSESVASEQLVKLLNMKRVSHHRRTVPQEGQLVRARGRRGRCRAPEPNSRAAFTLALCSDNHLAR
eukprot:5407698-Heterocapsa_arctica.AAC.1